MQRRQTLNRNTVIIPSQKGNIVLSLVVAVVLVALDKGKGGRPSSSTQNNREVSELILIKAKNDLVTIHE